jgi:hypothetical protein
MKGSWRPKYSYAFHSFRNQNDNIRNDGTFDDFQRFPWENPTARSTKWVRANTVSKILPHDFEVENVDPIGVFSSALYGYNFTLPVAVSKNARYNEIAFDGFEDYPISCEEDHFKFYAFSSNISTLFSHTGKYSMAVNTTPVSTIKTVKPLSQYQTYDQYTVNNQPLVIDNTPGAYLSGGTPVAHLIVDNDLIGQFAPIAGKKYVISAWVHQNPIINATTALSTFTDPSLQVNTSTSVSFYPSGNIIDGWQRIYGEFTIPSTGATNITVTLYNGSTTGNTAYFDDIRIHPFDANMESYVYDPITLKPIADLDANNYATIYNYDDEGHLIKIKRETQAGIKTVKEGRINTKEVQ